jgi:dihydrofolate reductase
VRRVNVLLSISLDGVIQAPGRPEEDTRGGFTHGGWSFPYADEDFGRFIDEVFARPGAFLLGRRTYDIFAATWPLAGADDPIGTTINTMRKYVASRTLDRATWQNSTVLTGDVVAQVRELKRGDGAELQVHGSGHLVQTLIEHDLVDEFHLHVIPVLVGTGNRLFGTGTIPAGLRLVESTTSATGVHSAVYARAGELQYGALGPETGNW